VPPKVRRDFALDHREKLLLLVFLVLSYYASLDFIVLKVRRDVYDIVFCFASIRRRRRRRRCRRRRRRRRHRHRRRRRHRCRRHRRRRRCHPVYIRFRVIVAEISRVKTYGKKPRLIIDESVMSNETTCCHSTTWDGSY